MASNKHIERTPRDNYRCKKELCMTTGSIYANGILVFTLSGAFLVLVGFVMPYWVTFDHKPCLSNGTYEVTVYVSIWYGMVCDMDSPTYCRMKGIGLALHRSDTFKFSELSGCNAEELSVSLASRLGKYILWTAVPILTTTGLGLIFVAAIMVEVWRCAGYSKRKFVTAICFFLLLGGVLVLAMVILVIVGVTRSFGVPKYKIEVGTFNWSLLTSGIGSLLVLVGGCLAFKEVRNWNEPAKTVNLRDIDPGPSTYANPTFAGDVADRVVTNKSYSGAHDNIRKPRETTGPSSAYSGQRLTDYDVGRGGAYGYSYHSNDNYGRASTGHLNQRFNYYDGGRGGLHGDTGRPSLAHPHQRSAGYDAGWVSSYGISGRRQGGTGHTEQRQFREQPDQDYYLYSRSSKQRYASSSAGYDAGLVSSYGNSGRRQLGTGHTEQRHFRDQPDQDNYLYSRSSKQRHAPSF